MFRKAGAPWVAVISETFASRFFPNEDPIGKQILLRYDYLQVDEERPRQIIGVVGEVKQTGMGGVHPLVYESYLQQPEVYPSGSDGFHLAGTLVIRTKSDVQAHEGDIIATVKQIDPDQPITHISTMEDVLKDAIGDYQAYVLVFAGIAVVLAAIGVYGLLSYFVNQRVREMIIRYVLGAQRSQVLILAGKLGVGLVTMGLSVGVALALALNRYMSAHFKLYHIKATDPPTYAAVGVLFLSIAVLACYLPARRATNLDPMTILRHE